MGSSATTATAVFGRAYGAVPNCIVTQQAATVVAYTVATTSIAITQNTASGNKINYLCTGTTS